MKILVTGATGMVGRALVERLSEENVSLTTTSLDAKSPWPGIRFERVDLRDFDSVVRICRGQDVVMHIAGIKGSVGMTKQKPATFMGPLLQMNANVFAACQAVGVSRVVYTSSIGVYPLGELLRESDLDWSKPPMDTHPGWAKRMGELHLAAIHAENPGFSYAIVRPSNVYGPGDNFNPKTAMVIGALLGRAHNGEVPITVQGTGDAVRDFVYSEDVADALVRLAGSQAIGDLNVGAGSGISIRELASHISDVTRVPIAFNSDTANEGFSTRVLSVDKARQLISWEPRTTIKDGLDSTWRWLLAHGSDQVGRLDYFAN